MRGTVGVEADVLTFDRQRGDRVLVRLLRELHGVAVGTQTVALREERSARRGLGRDDVIILRLRSPAAAVLFVVTTGRLATAAAAAAAPAAPAAAAAAAASAASAVDGAAAAAAAAFLLG